MINIYYAEDLLEEIRLNNDIVDVVSEYVKLERRAKYYYGLCPFHREKTPSFTITPTKQIFYCFGCEKGGNVFQFIMNIENLDFTEAVRFLADRARIQLSEGNSREDIEKSRIRQEILDINKEAARYFHDNLRLPASKEAGLYLKKRGVTSSILRRFGLGFAPFKGDQLFTHLMDKGYNEESIVKSGLVMKSKNGGYYDRFRGRLMFPIFDLRGNVIAFGGRVVDSSMPKYMNSPESLIYNKGRNLYALNFAKNSGEKKIIIVEGYLDVISLHQGGIINSVASLGTALTENQGRILKKYAEEIIIAYDADTAGQAATIRGLDLLNDLGCTVKVLLMPEGKDPDEFMRKHGSDEFKKLVDNSITLIDYKVKTIKKQIDTKTTEGKIKFVNRIADLLSRIDNRIEVEMYVKKLAKEYDISEESVYVEVMRRIKPKERIRTNNIVKLQQKRGITRRIDNRMDNASRDELLLLALLSLDNSVFNIVKDRISLEDFDNNQYRKIADYTFERLDNNKEMVPAELLNIFDGETSGTFAKILEEECNFEDNNKAAIDIARRLRTNRIEKRKQEIFKLLANRDNFGEGDVEKLTIELNSLIMQLKSI